MSNQPLILSREEHVNEIMRHWRGKQIDEAAADIIFDEQLRSVAFAMAEPRPQSEKRLPHILGMLALNSLLWFGVITVGWAMLR